MNKKDAYHFGQLIEQIHFTPLQKRKLLATIPFLSEKKLKKIYKELKGIAKAEQAIDKDIMKMQADVASGKVKVDQ